MKCGHETRVKTALKAENINLRFRNAKLVEQVEQLQAENARLKKILSEAQFLIKAEGTQKDAAYLDLVAAVEEYEATP